MSYPVSGLGKPQNGGEFPIVEDVDFLGGFQVQPTTTARDAIPLLNQKVGMWCWVTASGGTLYQLTATGSPGTWAAVSIGGGAPAGAAGGDLGGTYPNPSVLKINGISVANTGASEGRALTSHGDGTATWVAIPSGFTAGGDVGGSSTSQDVLKVHGASVPIAGSLTTGNALYVSGAASLAYSALNLAGGSAWVTGQLPVANQASQLAGVTAVTGTAAWGYSLVATGSAAAAWTAPVATPTGTGFAHYVASIRDAAAKKVDLVNDIDTTTVLPGANGGGPVNETVSVTTTNATVTLVPGTAKTLTAWQMGDFLVTVLARTGAGACYRVELIATYVANAGGPVVLTPVNPPTLQNGYGSLTGLDIAFDVSAGVVTVKITGLAATTIYWNITQIAVVI